MMNERMLTDLYLSDFLYWFKKTYEREPTESEKELGLQIDPDTVRIPEALTMGVSYIIGSVFPLIAYFFLPIMTALPVSLVLTVVALIAIGVIKGRLASINLVRSALEVVVVGVVSALGGYFLGSVVPHLLGLNP